MLRIEEQPQQMYGWVEPVPVRQEFARQGKAVRGLRRRAALIEGPERHRLHR